MPTPKQSIAFVFGAVDQATGTRVVPVGTLIEATNVRMVEDGEYSKRPGFGRLNPGQIVEAESLTFDGSTLISRDTEDKAWAEDLNSGVRTTRGQAPRALPKEYSSPVLPRARKPMLLPWTDGYYAMFIMADDPSNGAEGFAFWVVDATTFARVGTVHWRGAPGIRTWGAANDGTYVWVMWADADTVYSSQVTIALPGTAPSPTTFYAETGGAVAGVDIDVLGNGLRAVAITSFGDDLGSSGLSETKFTAAYLDDSGGPAASPATLSTQSDSIALPDTYRIGPPTILVNGTSAAWSAAYYRWDGTNVILTRATMVTATLFTTFTALDTDASGSGATYGIAVGWQVALVPTILAAHGSEGDPDDPYVLKRYVGGDTPEVVRNASWPASKPVSVGTRWLMLTGYADEDLQQTLFLVDAETGEILTPVLNELATGPGLDPSSPAEESRWFATTAQGTATASVFGVLQNVGGGGADENSWAPTVVNCDRAASFGAPVAVAGMVVVPGGVATVVSGSDDVHEVAPLLFPGPVVVDPGSGTPLGGSSFVEARFRRVNSRGEVTPSAPGIPQEVTFTDGSDWEIAVPPLTHFIGDGTGLQIEIYASVPGTTLLFLAAVKDNDPGAAYVTFTAADFDVSDPPVSQLLDSQGGGLTSAPPPAFNAVGTWGDRVLGSSRDWLWYSEELATGAGPLFNEILRVRWLDGTGDILGHGPVDANVYALLKADRVGYITGAGPDGVGRGNYKAWPLAGKHGLLSPRSVVQGPPGLFFQDVDGRIRVITGGLAIADAFRGMESYRSELVTAAVHVEKLGQVWFATDERIMVLDYMHPTAEQPVGRWFNWTSAGLSGAAGATVGPDGAPYLIEAALGVLRTPGAGWVDATADDPAQVLEAFETGDLAAAGKLQGFLLAAVAFAGEYRGPATVKLTVIEDNGAASTAYSKGFVTAPVEMWAEPGNCDELVAIRVRVEETDSESQGFVPDAVSLVVQSRGRTRFPSNDARVDADP